MTIFFNTFRVQFTNIELKSIFHISLFPFFQKECLYIVRAIGCLKYGYIKLHWRLLVKDKFGVIVLLLNKSSNVHIQKLEDTLTMLK